MIAKRQYLLQLTAADALAIAQTCNHLQHVALVVLEALDIGQSLRSFLDHCPLLKRAILSGVDFTVDRDGLYCDVSKPWQNNQGKVIGGLCSVPSLPVRALTLADWDTFSFQLLITTFGGNLYKCLLATQKSLSVLEFDCLIGHCPKMQHLKCNVRLIRSAVLEQLPLRCPNITSLHLVSSSNAVLGQPAIVSILEGYAHNNMLEIGFVDCKSFGVKALGTVTRLFPDIPSLHLNFNSLTTQFEAFLLYLIVARRLRARSINCFLQFEEEVSFTVEKSLKALNFHPMPVFSFTGGCD